MAMNPFKRTYVCLVYVYLLKGQSVMVKSVYPICHYVREHMCASKHTFVSSADDPWVICGRKTTLTWVLDPELKTEESFCFFRGNVVGIPRKNFVILMGLPTFLDS